jgi:hypothetical protein
MPEAAPAPAQRPDPARGAPARPGRAGRAAWRAGWVLLVLVSMAVAYALLVVAGR